MSTKDIIQDALDDLASTKSSTARQGRALDKLERLVAEICVTAGTGSTEALQSFVSLQDTFECNVPFRLLVWISSCLSVLSVLSSKSSTTNHDAELTIISTQIAQALSIIQGTALIHAGSKRYLGRRYPLEVLVDLFYSSRRAPPVPTSVSTNLSVPSPTSMYSKRSKDSTATSIPLANIVLDTLLCILVDAPSSLRVFESVNGVHTLVKMFKRAATPREVRMRCIEFLYFYLMDESLLSQPSQDLQTHSHPHSHSSSISSTSDIPQIPTAPNSPVPTPSQHRHGSALSVSQMSDSSVSSVDSYVTSSTTASNSTKATSVSSRSSSLAPSPQIVDQQQHQQRHARSGSAQPRPLSLLRAEEQLKPPSAKHVQAKLGVGTPRQPPSNPNREKLRRIDTNMTSSTFTSTSTTTSEIERDAAGNITSTSTSSLAARLEDLHLELPTPRQHLAPRLQSNSLSQINTPTTPNPHSGAQRLLGHRRAQSTIEVSSTSSMGMMGTPAVLKSLARSTSPMSAVPPSPADSLMGSSGLRERGERGEKGDRTMPPPSTGVKSMAEKKAFLGTMLGNVDALVESIQKAGILGLI
ncbi:cell division control protein 14, SIN component-domain-containing protein [Irpex lacteus]|nr:cell division control protein 14, SIN component-domain-containing protein [Irpex lacteus]